MEGSASVSKKSLDISQVKLLNQGPDVALPAPPQGSLPRQRDSWRSDEAGRSRATASSVRPIDASGETEAYFMEEDRAWLSQWVAVNF